MGDLTVYWAADDRAGDPVAGSNPMGFYLNGVPLNITGGDSVTQSTATIPNVQLLTGTNTFFAYQRETGQNTSGLIYSAMFTIPTTPLTMDGLRNFDVIPPLGLNVNDFHIELKGIDANATPPQIDHIYPQNLSWLPSNTPSGWYPATTTTNGTDTLVSYGGPTAQPWPRNQTPHFGVALTSDGKDNLDEICMYWTENGVPVFDGGDASMPLTVLVPDPNGGTTVHLVNQTCSLGLSRWVGPVHVGVIDRLAILEELVSGSQIVDDTDIIANSATLLSAGEEITFNEVSFPMQAGQSIVVWYDVFQDESDVQGTQIGTVYDAFNFTVDAEPGDFDANGLVDGSDFLQWQRGESTNPLSASDLVAWEGNYGSGIGSVATPSGAPVPEPATFALAGMCTILVLLWTPQARSELRKQTR